MRLTLSRSLIAAVMGSAVLMAGGGQMPPDDGELWVTSQGTDRLFIVHGQGASVETLLLPVGAGPHITTFSPSGDFAYVSGMGSGDLYILRADDRQLIPNAPRGPCSDSPGEAVS